MSIENGTPDYFNCIHAGWAGKGNNKGCYNYFNCAGGFVQVDKDHPIGRVLPTSIYDQTPIEIPLLIHQDKSTKDWWLVNLDNKSLSYGYWPMELLPQLTGGALSVAWGGVRRSNQNALITNLPDFNGTFPSKHYSGRHINISATFWQVSNIIYLDSPAGVGLSYSENQDDYYTGDIKTAYGTHTFLLKNIIPYPIVSIIAFGNPSSLALNVSSSQSVF
ncbi:hypothetical protein IFM89_027175 [Coptis chinensis]|uniref:Neprosin PEP catalytic domain-containing protein n=1 Tax=Coptis chinensis TaxID=261450 RepID=A0A835IF00_9MAGN|nr:hypothetical protein IFM89_027175 [Coptis chinensis]